jgi:hypothetical protein
MKNIKNFENWRAEQLAKVFLSRFENLIIKTSNKIELDFIIGVDYDENTVDELFGIEIKAGKKRSWFTKHIRDNRAKYEDYKFPVLLFLFNMESDEGYFSWIVKPLSNLSFTSKFKFYHLTDKRMEGIIGLLENWYFEKNNKFFINRLNEIWKNTDNKKLKVYDRIYFSCTEDWEVDTLREKILDKYPSYTMEEVNKSIKHCCKSRNAPFERMAFENCVLMNLRFKI